MTFRGPKLNDAIEKELIEMVAEGYHVSPISNQSLYQRLKSKGILNGAISTLTSRTDLINIYKSKQIEEVSGALSSSLRDGLSLNKQQILKQNARLREEVDLTKQQIANNTETLIEIVKTIKATGASRNIEQILSPYLIRELKNKY